MYGSGVGVIGASHGLIHSPSRLNQEDRDRAVIIGANPIRRHGRSSPIGMARLWMRRLEFSKICLSILLRQILELTA